MSAPSPHGSEAKAPVELHKIANGTAHELGEEGEPWLLSYADMVTLLMCFFILFFSVDKSHGGIADPERLKAKLERLISVQVPVVQSSASQSSQARRAKTEKLKQAVQEQLKTVPKDVKVVLSLATPEPGILEISLLSESFFAPGEAALTTTGNQILARVLPRVAKLERPATLEIEGHTDSTPVKSGRFSSNWELSTARAASVAKYFEAHGVAPEIIMLSGFGEHRPLIKETDERGLTLASAQRINRRIVLRIHLPMDDEDSATAPRP